MGANPLWGAPRIHGELVKLGLESPAIKRGLFTCLDERGNLLPHFRRRLVKRRPVAAHP
jgi:hypothetical protein